MNFLIPNALPASNLLMGLAAIACAWRGQPVPACWMILGCALLDGLDGPAARRWNGKSGFGSLFDSCADFVSFGLAPAALFYRSGASAAGAAAIYLFCAAARLIRFQRMTERERAGDFLGLPTTASGALYAAGRLWGPFLPGWELLPAAGILALSGLMISRLRFPRIINSAEAKPAIPSL